MRKYIFIFITFGMLFSQKLLIPMDQFQTDHLKAYGAAFWSLKKGDNVDWLLNYRGGSFMMNYDNNLERELKIRGVYYEPINTTILTEIFALIEDNNDISKPKDHWKQYQKPTDEDTTS